MSYLVGDGDWEHIQPKDLIPVAVPTSPDSPVTTDNLYLEALHFVNNTAVDAVVTVIDKQTSPHAVAVASVPAYSDWLREYKGRRCPGGLTWSADIAGVVGYVRGRW